MAKKKSKKKESYLAGVKSEVKKISWPTFKEVIKFTIATLVFIIVVTVFFLLLNVMLSTIVEVVK